MEAESTDSRASPAPQTSSDVAAPSKPTYAVQPKWSHDDDHTITVVQSTHDYTQRVFQTKPASARWVRGLGEGEDDVLVGGGFRRRTNMRKWEELDDTPDDVLRNGAALSHTRHRPWLFSINIIGVLYICLLAFRVMKGLHRSYRLDFPSTERQLQAYGRRYGENGISFLMRVAVPLGFPHCVGAVYVMLLAYRLGGAAHHFVGLWGVGLALISLSAAFTQCSVLFSCCELSSISQHWECDLPFVFHHVCSAIRFMTPLLALWCVAPVIDSVRGGGWRWKFLLALPCVMAFICLCVSTYAGEPSVTLLDASHGTVLLVWPLFIKSCWLQPCFVRIPPSAEKSHED